MRRRVLPLVVLVFLASSCATKKEAVIAVETLPSPPTIAEASETPAPQPEPVTKDKSTITTPAEPVILEEEADRKYIVLNFENTDIRTIIDTFGEILGINYILTPGISGTVTIQSYDRFPVEELFYVFQSVLEINGLTAVKEASFYRIVPLDTAKQQSLDVDSGKALDVRLDGSFLTQLIPLQYAKASDIAGILRNLMPRGADLIVYEPANMLIVTALPPTLVKFMKLISALDEQDTESIRTFVYHVENGEAKKLAEILKTLYPEDKTPRAPSAAAPPVQPPARAPAPSRAETAESLPGEIGAITVTAYEDINALIIKCSPRTYVSLLEVLKQIDVSDISVRQVVIEVLIAEITLRDSTDFGIQWLLESGATTTGFSDSSTPRTGWSTDPPEPIFAALISGTIDKTFIQAFITALASESRVNVLANPHVLALDNKAAEIKIGDEIPTATGLTQQPATGGGTTLVSSGQIQYRTVGTILKVTPHITEAGNVNMDIVVEKSGVGQEVTLGTGTFPSFTTQTATTSAVVSTGQTLFIGGLISDSKSTTRRGLPVLSKIPVLGYLFGTTTDTVEKRELLVLVTPHVIENRREAEEITRGFQRRVKTIKKRLEHLDSTGTNVYLPEKVEVEETAAEQTEE